MEVLLKWLMRDCGVVVMSGDVRLSNLLSYLFRFYPVSFVFVPLYNVNR